MSLLSSIAVRVRSLDAQSDSEDASSIIDFQWLFLLDVPVNFHIYSLGFSSLFSSGGELLIVSHVLRTIRNFAW